MSRFLRTREVDVVGISGPAYSGKDYMAQRAIRWYGFLPLPLANHFKVELAVLGSPDLPAEEADARQLFGLMPKDVAHRNAMQQRGTERGRNVHGNDVWCLHAEAWMFYFARVGNIRQFVIPDVRHASEVAWIHRLGGKVYRLTGRGGVMETEQLAAHSSEHDLDGALSFDLVIDNSVSREKISVLEFDRAILNDFPGLRGPREDS